MPSINDDIGTKVNNNMFLLNVNTLDYKEEEKNENLFTNRKEKESGGKWNNGDMDWRNLGAQSCRHCTVSLPVLPLLQHTLDWVPIGAQYSHFSSSSLVVPYFFSSLVPYYCNIMIWSCLAGSSSQLSESWSRAVIFIQFFLLQDFLQSLQYQYSS